MSVAAAPAVAFVDDFMAVPTQDLSWIQLNQVVEANYLAANTLLFYDHFLTFDREVRHIWARKRSASSILFFGIRYPALAVAALTLTDLVPFNSKTDEVRKLGSSSVACADARGSVVSTDVRTLPVFGNSAPADDWHDRCSVVVRTEMLMCIILLAFAAVFSGLRAFALVRHKNLAIVVIALGMISPAISLIGLMAFVTLLVNPFHTCVFTTTISEKTFGEYVPIYLFALVVTSDALSLAVVGLIVARVCTVLADVIVLAVTWTRTWRMRVEAASANLKSTLAAVLWKNGTVYFIVLLIANLVSLALIRNIALVYVTALWITTFTAVMTCRFILDLHEAARSVSGGPTTFMDNRTLPPISFTDVETRPPSAEAGAPVTSSTIFGAMVSYGQCELELQAAAGEDEDDVDGTGKLSHVNDQHTEQRAFSYDLPIDGSSSKRQGKHSASVQSGHLLNAVSSHRTPILLARVSQGVDVDLHLLQRLKSQKRIFEGPPATHVDIGDVDQPIDSEATEIEG
ncbi:hypothetical protein C8Q76DRAFT_794885 [Earliella scabrosa]|nr:hypothetical protein C8Q76DRAFT_794885 [Earliella scabrosa]